MEIAALVACGKSKREPRHPSWSLYDSVLFEKSMTAAMLCGHPYIMSAKHGLVSVTERLDWYNEYLGNKDTATIQEWSDNIVTSLPDRYDTVVLFGGSDYTTHTRTLFDEQGLTVYTPFSDTTGNGQQMSVAGDISTRILDGEDVVTVLGEYEQ